MVTVKEVARMANVSPATVSRVINSAHNVSPEIRERVQRVIKDMNYFPNHAARSLVRRQAGAIAVLLRNLHHPFFFNLIRGFEDSAAKSERSVIFCSLGQEQEYRDRYIQFLTNGISDAIILYGTLFTDRPIIEHLASVNFPFLLIENNFEDIRVNQLLVNNLEGAKNAVEHLIARGHRRIALFMGDPNKKVNLERFNGYTQVMQKYGFPIGQNDIKNIYSDYSAAYGAAREMMQLPPEARPTAVFAINDRIATQVIMGVQSLGFSVPEDLSVIGFDNQKLFDDGYSGPAITSIKQPLFEMGKDSITILTDILEGKVKTPFTKTYETQLIPGDTVDEPSRK
ncbi:LacI family DNA-binding transcriptional regulator [Breznakiella homolactica]|uniref:LacI family DNA-binding transcriptional regulator n=1 Tax=Breznakiella homolactica TaxID=2798577 RepID=A0A7T8BCL2_9SPIR|nr:LacI family DNA-binding transcriptional regulator [Breznakiella homolactica]QQO11240.1 LacI family transcriptional regulator [Breznakiella homolactica]